MLSHFAYIFVSNRYYGSYTIVNVAMLCFVLPICMTKQTWNMQYNMTSLLLDTQVLYKQQKLFYLNIL